MESLELGIIVNLAPKYLLELLNIFSSNSSVVASIICSEINAISPATDKTNLLPTSSQCLSKKK